ncbi:MAG TPA: hypothetical protein VI033_05750 [Candidatus Nitrosopolaris sp.]
MENIMKTDLKSKIGIAEMSLHQVVRVLNKQLVNDYYLLFTKALHSRLRSSSTSLLGSVLRLLFLKLPCVLGTCCRGCPCPTGQAFLW